MSLPDLLRPAPGEYPPYYEGYFAALGDTDPLALLDTQPEHLRVLLGDLPEAQQRHRYAPGKWSVREVAGHLGDVEQVFGYRLLRVSLSDPTPLAGFEQDDYVTAASYDDWAMAHLLDRFAALRRANALLIRSFHDDVLTRIGTASGGPISVRALVRVLVAHVVHHERILRERYLG